MTPNADRRSPTRRGKGSSPGYQVPAKETICAACGKRIFYVKFLDRWYHFWSPPPDHEAEP